MIVRLLLALLITLPASLLAGQHLACSESLGESTPANSHAHHAMQAAEHLPQQASMAEQSHAHDAQTMDCENCELACFSACTAAALPTPHTEIRISIYHGSLGLPQTVSLLLPHSAPLLRPPTHLSA